MTIDRNGDIGFMEAMAGAMTVCIVMMAFVAFIMAYSVSETETEDDFNWDLLGEIVIESGRYSLNNKGDFDSFIDQHDLTGFSIKISASYDQGPDRIYEKHGTTSEYFNVQRKMISVDDGERLIPTVLEVKLFH